jgi:hypothetical protein
MKVLSLVSASNAANTHVCTGIQDEGERYKLYIYIPEPNKTSFELDEGQTRMKVRVEERSLERQDINHYY